jgi:hypothetical protein
LRRRFTGAGEADVELPVLQLDDHQAGRRVGPLEGGHGLGTARWRDHEVGCEDVVADVVDIDVAQAAGQPFPGGDRQRQRRDDDRTIGESHDGHRRLSPAAAAKPAEPHEPESARHEPHLALPPGTPRRRTASALPAGEESQRRSASRKIVVVQ